MDVAAHSERERALVALSREQFDVVVVGGGITGCGIARDAALRGLKTALVEKRDFASGTSSKSSKLVHGGLRYLELAELGLVFESVSERRLLMRLARHLVRPIPFLVANYVGDPRRLSTLNVGLWIYDAMCLFRSYRNHRTYRAKRTAALEPGLRREGLRGGIVYYDCLTDDARLTLENALDARRLGAVVVNHARAGALLRDGDRVVGLTVSDALTGNTIDVRGRVLINATGPWSDEVRALAGDAPILAPTKGVHIVIDEARLPVRHALMMLAPKDHRAVFCIPWGLGRTVIGTTDTFFSGSPDQVEPSPEDVAYLLDTGNHYFPDARLSTADVLSTWSGLRPLLRPPGPGRGASQVSREHSIYERPGLVTIAGGKLTTYRRMAAEVVDRSLLQLNINAPSMTGGRPLPGTEGLEESDELLAALARTLESTEGVSPATAAYLSCTYGVHSPDVLRPFERDPSARERLDPELPHLAAQVDYAVDQELACTLDDVLVRRVPLALRARDQGLGIAPTVARRMAARLGWSESRTESEIASYRTLVASSRRFREA